MEDLIGRLRAWARRFEVHSPERKLMIEAATAIEELAGRVPAPPPGGITAEMIEAAMGGKKLLPWQERALSQTPPPSSQGG